MALYWFLHAYSMNLFRMARDATFYRLLIAPFGRLPSANSFLITYDFMRLCLVHADF